MLYPDINLVYYCYYVCIMKLHIFNANRVNGIKYFCNVVDKIFLVLNAFAIMLRYYINGIL